MQSFISTFKAKEATRFKLKVGVFAVVMKDDNVLLLRRYQTGSEDGMYVLPMGGHDGKEPLTQAVIREAKEEVNIDVLPEDLSLCHVMHRFHHMPQEELSFEQIDMIFAIKCYAGIIHNNEPDKCDALDFFPIGDLPDNTAPFIKKILHHIQGGQFYSEFGFSTGSD